MAKKKKASSRRVRAVSGKTGLTHEFPRIDAIEKLAEFYAEKYEVRLKGDLFKSISFFEWLESVKIKKSLEDGPKAMYRVVFGAYDPLSVAGSLACGGRFNIGGAQLQDGNLFPGLRMAACLYGASSVECGRAEAGDPLGAHTVYKLIPKKKLIFWDLADVLPRLKYPGLVDIVNATPMSANWVLQKSPLVSQIISHHLRKIGGDGLYYPSQKHSKGRVYAAFLRDDKHAHEVFDSRVVEEVK